MKDKLLIIGAGGHGKVVADIALYMNKWKHIAFLDDKNIKFQMGIEVIGKTTEAFKYIGDWDIFVAIGDNGIRENIQNELKAEGASFPMLIHPTAVIGRNVEIGEGSVVMANAVINCCTKIGSGCIINTGATIDHDNYIEDYVHISPGVNLAGSVRIGKGAWIGIGSVVINNLSIVSNCIIGAGSVVVRNIEAEGTYVGVPARRLMK